MFFAGEEQAEFLFDATIKSKHIVDNMNKMLTILITNYNTSKYIEVVLYALHKLTKNPYEVIICDNGSDEADILDLCKIVRVYTNISLIFRKQTCYGSIGHGEALDHLVKRVSSPYFVILDADCVFLQKGWDNFLIKELTDTSKCIGTPPVPNPIKPTDFPNMFGVLYETETYRLLSSPSFSPDPSWITSKNKLNEPSRDTGWEIRKKYLENGYGGICLEVKNTRTFKNGPFKDILCAEYYFSGSEKIFACHFGRGSSLGKSKYKDMFIGYIPYIGDYYIQKIGIREQKKWMQIVREIVAEED